MDEDFSLSGGDSSSKDFHYYLQKAAEAREQMTMGYTAIRQDFEQRSFKERIKDRLRTYGVGETNPQSIYSQNEQNNLAGSDFISNRIIGGANALLGGASLATGFLPAKGMAGAAMWGSMGTGMMGMGGISTGLGYASVAMNPYALAATLGIHALSYGTQETLIDPLSNSRLFQSTINSNLKGVIGGLNSNTGRGGMDLSTSFKLARNIDQIRSNNREFSPETINKFLEAGASMPQMQNIDSDKVAANMEKFVNIMVKLGKQFKGKENDLIQAMQQFSGMGMGLEQAGNMISQTSQIGKTLNIDPNRIMSAGSMSAGQVMGTNIDQTTGYYMGSKSFIQSETMKQRGQYSLTQLNNFGGSEGISQSVANSSMALLNSGLSDVFLKSLYTKDGGINQDNLGRLVTGKMGLRESQFRSQNITLSPESNMKYQFDKQSIISNLGENSYGAANQMFNQLAVRNPWGNSIQGRAKYAMQLGIAPDMQSARLFAQQNMAYNPMLESITADYKLDQQIAGEDYYYSSGSGLGRTIKKGIHNIDAAWTSLKRDTPFKLLNRDTQAGKNFLGGFANVVTGGISRGLINYLDKSASDIQIQGLETFKGIGSMKEFNEITKFAKENIDSKSPKDQALNDIARSSLYRDYNMLNEGADRDMVRSFSKKISEKYSTELTGITDPIEYRKRQMEIVKEETKNNPELTSGYFNMENGTKIAKNSMQGQNVLMGSMPIDSKLLESSKDSISLKDKRIKDYDEIMEPNKSNTQKYGESILRGVVSGWSRPIIAEGYDWVTGRIGNRDRFNTAKDKFNNADVEERKKMIDELDKYIKSDEAGADPNRELGAEFGEMFGSTKMDTEEKKFLRDQINGDKHLGEKGEILLKGENMTNSINMIFGSKQMKDSFGKYGNENLGLGIVKKFFNQAANKEELKIGEKELSQLRKDFGNDPGLGGIIKKLHRDSEGNVEFGDMSQKTKERLLGNFQAQYGAGFNANKIMSSPAEIWDHNRFNKANTIADFSVAVAKGMMIYEKNKDREGTGEMTEWIKTASPTTKTN